MKNVANHSFLKKRNELKCQIPTQWALFLNWDLMSGFIWFKTYNIANDIDPSLLFEIFKIF